MIAQLIALASALSILPERTHTQLWTEFSSLCGNWSVLVLESRDEGSGVQTSSVISGCRNEWFGSLASGAHSLGHYVGFMWSVSLHTGQTWFNQSRSQLGRLMWVRRTLEVQIPHMGRRSFRMFLPDKVECCNKGGHVAVMWPFVRLLWHLLSEPDIIK